MVTAIVIVVRDMEGVLESDASVIVDDMAKNGEAICEYVGHDWHEAGGGLLICSNCLSEIWDDELTST